MSANNEQPLAATVAFVHGDRMVNLSVVDANGYQFSRTSVRLIQEGDDRPENGGFAEWMPYQIGQAKKHDSDADNTQKIAE